MKQTLYKHKNILPRLLIQPTYRGILFHAKTQLESDTSTYKRSLYKLYIFSVVIIISYLSVFRRESQLVVEQMYKSLLDSCQVTT